MRQDTSNVNWTSIPCFYLFYSLLYRVWRQAGFFLKIFVVLFNVRKKSPNIHHYNIYHYLNIATINSVTTNTFPLNTGLAVMNV